MGHWCFCLLLLTSLPPCLQLALAGPPCDLWSAGALCCMEHVCVTALRILAWPVLAWIQIQPTLVPPLFSHWHLLPCYASASRRRGAVHAAGGQPAVL